MHFSKSKQDGDTEHFFVVECARAEILRRAKIVVESALKIRSEVNLY